VTRDLSHGTQAGVSVMLACHHAVYLHGTTSMAASNWERAHGIPSFSTNHWRQALTLRHHSTLPARLIEADLSPSLCAPAVIKLPHYTP
jgi:hypothetical protein